jgi:hypothetical protein
VEAERWTTAERLVGQLRKADPLILLAEPGVAASVRLLGQPRKLVVVEDGDPRQLQAALSSKKAALLVLDGPPWLRPLATALAPRCSRAVVLQGDGGAAEGAWLRGAEHLAAPGAADPRFAGLGLGALVLAGLGGAEFGALRSSLEEGGARLALPGALDNPAYRLATVALSLAQESALTQPLLLFPGARLEPLVGAVGRAWTAICARARSEGLRSRLLQPARLLRAGDEASWAGQIEGPLDAWALSIWAETPAEAEVELEGGLSARQLWRSMQGAHVQQLAQAGLPVLRLRLLQDSAAAQAQALQLLTHAAVVLADLGGLDPLALAGADRWRELQQAEFGDNNRG